MKRSMVTLTLLAVLCWMVMFLAGTDIWHAAGSPDFWRQSGAPNADLRAFTVALYVQLFTLLLLAGTGLWHLGSKERPFGRN